MDSIRLAFASGSRSDRTFRIEQLGEARIVGHVTKVRVIAGLETISRVDPDGLGQMLQTLRGTAGETLQHGQAVPDEVQRWAAGWKVPPGARGQ